MSLPSCVQENMKNLLDQSKALYTITDKLSGQVYGHAFMLTDATVSLDQVQLLPWQVPGQGHGDIQPDREVISANYELGPGSLESDLDISEDSSVNSTVDMEDAFSVSGQDFSETIKVEDILDVSCSRSNTYNNDINEATLNEVIDDTKLGAKNNNLNSTLLGSKSGSSSKSVAQTIAADIASQLVAQKRAADRNDEDSLQSSHFNEPPVKRKWEESIPNKSRRAPSAYAAFYAEAGFAQPDKHGRKDKLVRCLLCKKERILSTKNFSRHVRAVHEPPEQCDICGGEFSSVWISEHKKICLATSVKSQELKAQELKRSENQLISKHVKVKLKSADRPEIGVKVTLKRNSKIKKAMKIFGKKFQVSRKKLRFVICGEELIGEELVSELKGLEISVHGEIK